MKIGFVTSWNEKCGVSEYSKTIVNGLRSLGYDVKVAANIVKDQVEPDDTFVKRFFHVHFMTGGTTKQENMLDMVAYLADCDIVHVQFETNLYHPDWFINFITLLKNSPAKLVFTMHSSGMWQNFPLTKVDRYLSHTKMWCTNDLVHFPVEFFNKDGNSKIIKSFGLGRNNGEHVVEAIKGLNVEFETSYGTSKWLTKLELGDWISDSVAIAVIYHPVGCTVSSSVAAVALGTNKPLLVANTEWCRHIMHLPGVFVSEYGDIKGLRENIEFILDPSNSDYINNEMILRKLRVIEEGWDLDSVCNKHLTIYKNLLKY